jgi:hypothetical protein
MQSMMDSIHVNIREYLTPEQIKQLQEMKKYHPRGARNHNGPKCKF